MTRTEVGSDSPRAGATGAAYRTNRGAASGEARELAKAFLAVHLAFTLAFVAAAFRAKEAGAPLSRE
jgi:hypothetical protein